MDTSRSPVHPVTEIVIDLQKFEEEEAVGKESQQKKKSNNSTTATTTSSSRSGYRNVPMKDQTTAVEIPLQDLYVDRQKMNRGRHAGKSSSDGGKDGLQLNPPSTVLVPYTTTSTSSQVDDTFVDAAMASEAPLDEDSVLIQTFMECFGAVAATAAPSPPPLKPPSNTATTAPNLHGVYVCVRHVNCPVIYGLYSFSLSKPPPSQQNEAFRINSCRYCYIDETRCGIQSRNTEQQHRPKSIYQILQLVQAYSIQQRKPGSSGGGGGGGATGTTTDKYDLLEKGSDHSMGSHTGTNSIGEYTISALFLQNSMDGGKSSASMNVPEVITTTTASTGTAAATTPSANTSQPQRRSLASRILLSYRYNYNNIMELSLKRIHQVQNFTLQLYKQQMVDYQQLIIKLQYDIIQKDSQYHATVKQLRRTIQQDCKVIKTMATQQQDVEYALGLSSQHNQSNISSIENNDPLLASMLGGESSHSISTVESTSPHKPLPQPFGGLTAAAGSGSGIPQQLINLKKVPFRTRSSMSQSTHHQQQTTEATIHESGLEDETETSAASDAVFEVSTMMNRNYITNAADVPATVTERSPPPASRDAILQLQQNWNRPKLRTRHNQNDELSSMKSSHEIFQSFRGGLLDIPRSPPALIRHDNVSIESDDHQNMPQHEQRPKGTKNKNKKIMMNSDMLSALQIPTRGLLSRSDSMVVPTNPNQISSNNDGMTPKNNSSNNYNHTLATLLVAKLQQEELDFRTNHGDDFNPIRDLTSPPPLATSMKPTAIMTTNSHNQQQQQQFPSLPLQSPDAKSPYPLDVPRPMININIPTMNCRDTTNEPIDTNDDMVDDDEFENDTAIEDNDVDNGTEEDHSNNNDTSDSNGNRLLFSVTNATCHDKFGDEGTYTGSILVTEGLPHGMGTMNYDSGRIYDGEWICGQWHGRGKLLNPNGDSYDGEFFFDARHGHGLYQWDNGDIYVGNFTSDKRHGRGKFSFHNGNVYEGEFCDGLFDGHGKYNFAGGCYEGDWKDGRYNGAGILTYGNTGGKYEGEFRNSVAHGFGTEIMPDGKQRRGVWVDGKPTEYLE